MSQLLLRVAPSSLSIRGDGPATGDIEVVIGNSAFPAEGWNDFVIVVLGAWCEAILRLLRRTSDSERVHFMEGPYAVDLLKLSNGLFRVQAVETRLVDGQRSAVDVSPRLLLKNAVAAAENLIEACHAVGHQSRDLALLKAALGVLLKEPPGLT